MANASLKPQSSENDPWMKRAVPSIGRKRMSNITGGCHCGAIRYQAEGEPIITRCAIARIVGATPARRWSAGRCTRWTRSR